MQCCLGLNSLKNTPRTNLDLHFSRFITHAKLATNDKGDFMKQIVRAYFIRSLPLDLMRKAGVNQFLNDDAMLLHLKVCMAFSRTNKNT